MTPVRLTPSIARQLAADGPTYGEAVYYQVLEGTRVALRHHTPAHERRYDLEWLAAQLHGGATVQVSCGLDSITFCGLAPRDRGWCPGWPAATPAEVFHV